MKQSHSTLLNLPIKMYQDAQKRQAETFNKTFTGYIIELIKLDIRKKLLK